MVVSGWSTETAHDVEVINLSGDGKTCAKPQDIPSSFGSSGMYFKGYPMVCGGVDVVTGWDSECYQYHVEVILVLLFHNHCFLKL